MGELPESLLENRCLRLLREYVAGFELNLGELTVLTEAATGFYKYTPIMCALAGARKVYAVAADNAWGKADQVKNETLSLSRKLNLRDRIEVVKEKTPEIVGLCDIVTNSGAVRPIDAPTVAGMKPTCVVPLMWETWEFRPWELDLDACRRKGILVMGTDESRMDWRYTSYIIWKLLNECFIEGHHCRIMIIASGRIGLSHARLMRDNGVTFRWLCFDDEVSEEFENVIISSEDKNELLAFLSTCDALVLDERLHEGQLIGNGGLFTSEELNEANPGLVLIYRDGKIDYQSIKDEGVYIYPDRLPRKKSATVYSYYLGPRPVFELYAAGLKVGEVMARNRIKGKTIREAARDAIRSTYAQDFRGEWSWLGEEG